MDGVFLARFGQRLHECGKAAQYAIPRGGIDVGEYIYRTLENSPSVPCACGASTRIITREDTPVANIHVTGITDARKHYHKEVTEFYYILEGTGEMELGKDVVELKLGVTILIPPGLAHRAYGDVKCLIVGVPAWKHDDEFFCEEG